MKSHGWKPDSLNYVWITARDSVNLIDFLSRDALLMSLQGSTRLLVTRTLSDLLVTTDSLARVNNLALCTVDVHCLDISNDYRRGLLNSIGCYNIGSQCHSTGYPFYWSDFDHVASIEATYTAICVVLGYFMANNSWNKALKEENKRQPRQRAPPSDFFTNLVKKGDWAGEEEIRKDLLSLVSKQNKKKKFMSGKEARKDLCQVLFKWASTSSYRGMASAGKLASTYPDSAEIFARV